MGTTHVDLGTSNVDQKSIVALEIQLDVTGLPQEEVDIRVRRLAEKLRQYPHKTVGIINKQTPDAMDRSVGTATEGRIALSLPVEVLPELVRSLRNSRGITLKGPNETVLNFDSLTDEEEQAWMNSVSKQMAVPRIAQAVTTAEADPITLPNAQELRDHARHHVESGAVTEEYLANRQQVITVLNQVLATELVCILRYKSHYYRASGLQSRAIRTEFLEHAREAEQHADQVATRIVQLNGAPDFAPEGLTSRSRSEFATGRNLREMIKEDLIAERIAVEFYSAIIRWLGDSDLTTRKVMQEILAIEAQHAEDMKVLFESFETDTE